MQSRQIVCTRPIWNPFPKRPQWRAVVFRDAGSVLRWPGIDYKSGPFLLQKPKCSEILSITFIFALLSCSGVKNKLISHGSKIFYAKSSKELWKQESKFQLPQLLARLERFRKERKLDKPRALLKKILFCSRTNLSLEQKARQFHLKHFKLSSAFVYFKCNKNFVCYFSVNKYNIQKKSCAFDTLL